MYKCEFECSWRGEVGACLMFLGCISVLRCFSCPGKACESALPLLGEECGWGRGPTKEAKTGRQGPLGSDPKSIPRQLCDHAHVSKPF